jgi:hypothetical protein
MGEYELCDAMRVGCPCIEEKLGSAISSASGIKKTEDQDAVVFQLFASSIVHLHALVLLTHPLRSVFAFLMLEARRGAQPVCLPPSVPEPILEPRHLTILNPSQSVSAQRK